MASWVVLISALIGCVGVILRSALQYVVVIWSLKDGEDRHQHALASVFYRHQHRHDQELPLEP
jgi:hypothetical protein